MNSDSSEPQWTPGPLDYVRDFFRGLPAAWIVIVTSALVVLAFWLGRAWPPYLALIHALKTAPLVTSGSPQSGVVKVAGSAQPGSGHASSSPYSKTPYVWFEAEKLGSRSTSSLRTTGSYSVATILIRDAAGDCAIDPQEAVILPALTRSDTQNRMFNNATYRSEKLILPGDPVFAIGEILRVRDRGPGSVCRLRPSAQGVLLVSGRTEDDALLRFRLYFWPAIAGMFLSLGVAVWAFRAHLLGYPNESLGEFFKALKTRPWMRYPGAER